MQPLSRRDRAEGVLLTAAGTRIVGARTAADLAAVVIFSAAAVISVAVVAIPMEAALRVTAGFGAEVGISTAVEGAAVFPAAPASFGREAAGHMEAADHTESPTEVPTEARDHFPLGNLQVRDTSEAADQA